MPKFRTGDIITNKVNINKFGIITSIDSYNGSISEYKITWIVLNSNLKYGSYMSDVYLEKYFRKATKVETILYSPFIPFT